MNTVCSVLRLVAAKNWEVYQMDVNNAFLHGDLEEKVYMKLPPGFRHSHPGKDLGKLKYFLGIEISRGPDGIFLSQHKYALDIIAETGNLGSRHAATPLEQDHKLATIDSPILEDPKPYRRLMGRLIYLLNTRPELCFPGQGIFFTSNPDLTLTVYCDADYNSCPLTRRSLSAFVVLLGGSPVAWKTKKQDTVSHSSDEAEYRAMVVALREIKWFRRVLAGLGIDQSQPTRLYCDNKAAIHIASNLIFHERTKHVESDCHAVRDAVEEGLIVTDHVRSEEQLVDILTKALDHAPFEYLLSKLGVRNLHFPT
ncbi:unnamed protein product [Microthlaspi erraticum]|uniref:Reverse transcriptase Ty1/copia-type domain-containing protein n=1 Tax=Microthlaspi erraticum TaxID=1685480 RepID=A0A6D2IIL5_9BRAS|nr:unnamed protein product [Microthlaspi erraticum]